MAQQLVQLTGKSRGGTTDTSVRLFNLNRISNVKASGTDSIFTYKEKNRSVVWKVDDTFSTVSAALANYDAGISIDVTVYEKNGVSINATESISLDKIIPYNQRLVTGYLKRKSYKKLLLNLFKYKIFQQLISSIIDLFTLFKV